MSGLQRSDAAAAPRAFVAVDCETTGLHPSAHHRIVELALSPIDESGCPEGSWVSLINPDRDLGPTYIHGIRGREVAEAPSFGEVIGEIADRLRGTTIVAHNARFDRTFLEHELGRAGVEVAPLPSLCTMRLAAELGIGGGRRRLGDCCEEIGQPLHKAHCASSDALGAAAILGAFIERFGVERTWAFVEGPLEVSSAWPKDGARAAPQRRSAAFDADPPTGALSRFLSETELPELGDLRSAAPYLDLLERAIEDRLIDEEESIELVATAKMLGIGSEQVERIHRDYINQLVQLAKRDGRVTEREREDLFLVAGALGVPRVEAMLDAGAGSSEEADRAAQRELGETVCFTGALTCRYEGELVTREVATHLAESAGMVVLPRVTKKLDVLVIADPNSRSEKARRARKYGTRVIAETVFWELLGVEVS